MTAPTPLLASRTIGSLRVHAIQAGGQQLDGGAMFGVVPKPLWERRLAADARNRIPMGMRCLLVEHDDGLVLIDTGAGNKEAAKFYDIYGIENGAEDGPGRDPEGRTALEAGIREAGFTPADVTLVINTHLHFDHAGGNTWRTPADTIEPSFPNATYVVHGGELAYARRANERTQASYFGHNWDPLEALGRLRVVQGTPELVPGIRYRHTPGHTPWHQSVEIASGGESALFLGDLVPTAHHLPLPWIMGYDVEPLVTLESKRQVLAEAEAAGTLLIFEHDAHTAWGRVAHDGKAFGLVPEP